MSDRRTLIGVLGAVAALEALLLLATPLRPRALHPLALLWLVALVLAFPRDRAALGVTALAALARAATWSPRVIQHFAKAYSDLDSGRGLLDVDLRYGDGWPALLGILDHALGDGLDGVQTAQALLSGLLPALLLDALRRRGATPIAAGTAGVLAALSPWALALAPTESRFVTASVLEVAAVAAVARADLRGDLLAVASLGLLAATRPELVPVAALILPALAARRRWAALGVATALIGARVVGVLAYLRAGGDTQGLHGDLPLPPWWTWVGTGSRVLALDPHVTPAAVGALAVVGGALALRAPAARLPLALLGAHLLLTVRQPFPSDLLRFQLPADAWTAALAGLGLGALAARARPATLVAGVAVAATWPAARPLDPPFVWSAEHARLRAILPRLPEGAVVRYAADLDRQDGRRRWIASRTQASWRPLDGPERPGELRWVGAADRAPGAAPLPRDRLEPIDVVEVAPRWGGLLDGGDAPVPIGLYRVR